MTAVRLLSPPDAPPTPPKEPCVLSRLPRLCRGPSPRGDEGIEDGLFAPLRPRTGFCMACARRAVGVGVGEGDATRAGLCTGLLNDPGRGDSRPVDGARVCGAAGRKRPGPTVALALPGRPELARFCAAEIGRTWSPAERPTGRGGRTNVGVADRASARRFGVTEPLRPCRSGRPYVFA